MNRKIGDAMNHQTGLDSKFLLDELIKQSNINRKWIDEESEFSEQRESRSRPSEEAEVSQEVLPRNTDEIYPEDSQEEIGDSFDESREYDSNKYMPMPEPTQEPIKVNPIQNEQESQKVQDGPAKPVWINPIPPEGLVTDYLESGLDGFGLKLPATGENNAKQS